MAKQTFPKCIRPSGQHYWTNVRNQYGKLIGFKCWYCQCEKGV